MVWIGVYVVAALAFGAVWGCQHLEARGAGFLVGAAVGAGAVRIVPTASFATLPAERRRAPYQGHFTSTWRVSGGGGLQLKFGGQFAELSSRSS